MQDKRKIADHREHRENDKLFGLTSDDKRGDVEDISRLYSAGLTTESICKNKKHGRKESAVPHKQSTNKVKTGCNLI